jgi:hypothetical protein
LRQDTAHVIVNRGKVPHPSLFRFSQADNAAWLDVGGAREQQFNISAAAVAAASRVDSIHSVLPFLGEPDIPMMRITDYL